MITRYVTIRLCDVFWKMTEQKRAIMAVVRQVISTIAR
jgi:hypothetical protein